MHHALSLSISGEVQGSHQEHALSVDCNDLPEGKAPSAKGHPKSHTDGWQSMLFTVSVCTEAGVEVGTCNKVLCLDKRERQGLKGVM